MARTDIHRPAEIQPEDYDFVGCEMVPGASGGDLGALAILQEERMQIRAHMQRTGGRYSRHAHGGVCHICGNANAIYTTLWHHRPSNVYIRVGSECSGKLEQGDGEAFRALSRIKDVVARARAAHAGKLKAEHILAEAGLTPAWDIYLAPSEDKQREELTVTDIVSNLVRYGAMSEKQATFLRTLLTRIENRAETERQRAEELARAADVPMTEERVRIGGTLLAVKRNEYTNIWKMLVQHEDGYKLWGSFPVALGGTPRGSKIEFFAQISRSDRDSKFGFFRRPTRAKVLEVAG